MLDYSYQNIYHSIEKTVGTCFKMTCRCNPLLLMNNLTHMLNKYLFPIFSDSYTTASCKKFTNI